MEYNETRGGWLVSVGQFLVWMATSAGVVVDALYIREAVTAILSAWQVFHTIAYRKSGGVGIDLSAGFALTTFDEILLIILGCGAVAAVVAIDYYFRRGRPKGLLLKRIGIVVGIEMAIVAASIIVRLLA